MEKLFVLFILIFYGSTAYSETIGQPKQYKQSSSESAGRSKQGSNSLTTVTPTKPGRRPPTKPVCATNGTCMEGGNNKPDSFRGNN